jgi:hypothetical protein
LTRKLAVLKTVVCPLLFLADTTLIDFLLCKNRRNLGEYLVKH